MAVPAVAHLAGLRPSRPDLSGPSRRRTDLRWVLVTGALWTPALLTAVMVWTAEIGSDAHAYWLTGQHADLYSAAPGTADAFLYSPAFATSIWPLTVLPWAVFRLVWLAAAAGAFAWLLAPLGLRYGVPAFCLCLTEVVIGNIYALLAVCAVLGMRYAGAWAFVLLTKITPAVGLVWFAVRREWKQLLIATGVTLCIAAVSFAMAPGAWSDWVAFLSANRSATGSAWWPLRVAIGYGLVVVAARRGTPWLLAPAMFLAQPMMAHWYVGLPLLAAIPRLRLIEATPARRARPAS